MVGPLERGKGGLGDLCCFLDRLEHHVAEPATPRGCLIVNTLVELGGSEPDAQRIVGRYLDRLHAAVTAALRRAAEQGETTAEDLRSRSNRLVALVIGVSAAGGADPRRAVGFVAAARDQVERWRS